MNAASPSDPLTGSTRRAPPVDRVLAELADLWRRERRRVLRHSDVEAVHRLRTATRRFQAGSAILAMTIGAEPPPNRAGWERLQRRLGRLRNLDVLRERLKAVQRQIGGDRDDALTEMAQHLTRRRHHLRDRAVKALHDTSIGPMLPDAQRADGVPIDHQDPARLAARWWHDQAAPLAGEPAWDRRLGPRTPRKADRAAFHAIRVQARSLRYGLEWWARLGLHPRPETVAFLVAVQDVLGALRDGGRTRAALTGRQFRRPRALINASLAAGRAEWPRVVAQRGLLTQPAFEEDPS